MAERVACVGAGVIGRSWAISFARAGFDVSLYDADPVRTDSAMRMIADAISDLHAAGLIKDAHATAARIRLMTDLDQAVQGVAYVQESIGENASAKRSLFCSLGELAPADAVLASSTSGIRGSEFMLTARHPERCLVAHPVNPPHLIPFVELVSTPKTSPQALSRARAILLDCGQRPIILRREIDGFVINRLQLAVIGEALHLVGEGYCSAQDVDWALKYGLGLRWAFLGVFETGHLNDDAGYLSYVMKFASMTRPLLAKLNVNYPWDRALIETIDAEMRADVPQDAIPNAQAWRDRRLAALRHHLEMAEARPSPAPHE